LSGPLTHYIVIRRDLTFGEYSAQLGHAGEAYLQRRIHEEDAASAGVDVDYLGFNEATCIVKGSKNESRLLKLEAVLQMVKLPHVAVREESGPKGGRLAGPLTCISLMPMERERVEHLLRDFHNIEALDGPKDLPA
jgi:hypothetical protein